MKVSTDNRFCVTLGRKLFHHIFEVLGDEEIIAEWQIKGIPKDNESTENMIIIEETIDKKFPIIIDP